MQTTITLDRAMEIARMPLTPEWSRAYDEACQGLRQAANLDTSDVSGVICESECSVYGTCPLKQAEDRHYDETVGARIVR